MPDLNTLDTLFVIFAFVVQLTLLGFFALRKWAFDAALELGWLVYCLGLPALLLSAALYLGGEPWYLWLGGVLYAVWAVFGYIVEYVERIEWRSPIYLPVFLPYVLLYLAMLMFYWWPLGTFSRPLWFVYAVLFVIATILNVTSHRRGEANEASSSA